MSLKRTNVYADPEDLKVIKDIAVRRGVPEAEIIREGIHLAALSNRVWEDTLDWPAFDGTGERVSSEEVRKTVASAAARGTSDL
jgi:hypothetical protein